MKTVVGYAGGKTASPSYWKIGDHSEAVLVEYDPGLISYAELLEVFWDSHNPVMEVFSRQYRNAIFYLGDEQRKQALKSLQTVKEKSRTSVFTKVETAGEFYRAEDYHQKYYLRKRHELLAELQKRYPDESFVETTEAARINGYLGCNGEKKEIAARLPGLSLSEKMQQRLVDYVSANCSRLAGLTCGVRKK